MVLFIYCALSQFSFLVCFEHKWKADNQLSFFKHFSATVYSAYVLQFRCLSLNIFSSLVQFTLNAFPTIQSPTSLRGLGDSLCGFFKLRDLVAPALVYSPYSQSGSSPACWWCESVWTYSIMPRYSMYACSHTWQTWASYICSREKLMQGLCCQH